MRRRSRRGVYAYHKPIPLSRAAEHLEARRVMSPQFTAGQIPIVVLMRSPGFLQGVEDVRAGRPPRFDDHDGEEDWAYERGRLWAVLAPSSMPLFVGKRVNKKALAIFKIVDGII